MEFIQNLPKPQPSKFNFSKLYFDIRKYAQMEKVLVFRNMLRHEHMDEYGIGTDCNNAGNIYHLNSMSTAITNTRSKT